MTKFDGYEVAIITNWDRHKPVEKRWNSSVACPVCHEMMATEGRQSEKEAIQAGRQALSSHLKRAHG